MNEQHEFFFPDAGRSPVLPPIRTLAAIFTVVGRGEPQRTVRERHETADTLPVVVLSAHFGGCQADTPRLQRNLRDRVQERLPCELTLTGHRFDVLGVSFLLRDIGAKTMTPYITPSILSTDRWSISFLADARARVPTARRIMCRNQSVGLSVISVVGYHAFMADLAILRLADIVPAP